MCQNAGYQSRIISVGIFVAAGGPLSTVTYLRIYPKDRIFGAQINIRPLPRSSVTARYATAT